MTVSHSSFTLLISLSVSFLCVCSSLYFSRCVSLFLFVSVSLFLLPSVSHLLQSLQHSTKCIGLKELRVFSPQLNHT